MKIVNEYTYLQIKKNKRHTISIVVAVLIASALLFSLCIFLYSFWQSNINNVIDSTGEWHGELYESINGEQLKSVQKNKNVLRTMVKGTWIAGQLSDCKKPYLLMRDGDKNFWERMNLKNTLMEGKLPSKEGELVLSKQFFVDNPSYHIGDTFTIPVGKRMDGNQEVDVQSYRRDGETFLPTDTRTYHIVGKLDLSQMSAYPGYIAMGYLGADTLGVNDELTVYIQLKNPRVIYKELPKIANEAGLKKDDAGKYDIKFNTPLLTLYGIRDKNKKESQSVLIIVMVVLLIMLVMGTFSLIIYNAFALSASSRSKELSILKSIGATPKQIKYSVLYEGFLLWLIQLPFGIATGYLFSYSIFNKMNQILSTIEGYKLNHLALSWWVILASVLISLLTVLMSAYVPARKMAKIPAVEGIQQSTAKFNPKKKYRILKKLFGMEGELAGRQFTMNRKSLRTAVISLSLCLVLMISYVNITAIYNLAKSKNVNDTIYNMSIELNILEEPDQGMLQELRAIPEVKDGIVFREVRTTAYIEKEQQSDEFIKEGGFDSVTMKYDIPKKDSKYKVIFYLVGLNDDSFKHYCEKIHIDASKYSSTDTSAGILYDSTYHESKEKKMMQIPMFNWDRLKTIHLNENVDQITSGNYEFDMDIKDCTNVAPAELDTHRYNAALIVPMSKYEAITAHFNEDRELEMNRMTLDLLTDDEDQKLAKEKAEKICSYYLGSDDYTIWSLVEEKEDDKIIQNASLIAVYGIAIMFAIIGIFNAVSTITNNLTIHKREYAMLRSVGLTPKGLNKILSLEGILFALLPIVVSIPLVIIICWFTLRLLVITWHEFFAVMPVVAISIYIGSVLLAIVLAYSLASRKVKHGNIMEAIKNEIV